MNKGHAELCSSRRWAKFIQDEVLPAALGTAALKSPALEIGPGYGAATEVLADATELTAIEIDDRLADRLAKRYPQVNVVYGDASAMPFDDRTFEAAFSFTMLHHVHTSAEQDALFAEAHRVLAPGSVFAGSDSIASKGLHAFHHHDTYTPVDPAALPDRLTAAGFADVDVRVMDDWFVFSARA